MKLVEALEILGGEQPVEAQTFRASLVCGFTPLHIQTFLTARLRLMFPDRRTEISSGIYGDFWGNLERLEGANTDSGIVVMEWSDLDPRMGFRSLGSWSPKVFDEIVSATNARANQFRETIQKVSRNIPVVVCFPTLPLAPISFTPGWQAGTFDLELRSCISSLGLDVARMANVRVLNQEQLDRVSPPGQRFDVKSELVSGFPYKLSHASAVADLLSRSIRQTAPKKGLITDLDDTLWGGILGEVGMEGVSWDLEHHTQLHGVYQKLLQALSEAGVLIGAASKNELRVVEEALKREDLVLLRDAVFPVEAHWGPKSESVGRILETWNIGADAVVFVDDSPMELAEVKAAHPEVECILFPKDDPQAALDLLYRLRDLFGKSALSEEDAFRSQSVRQIRDAVGNENHGGNAGNFLKQAQAELTLNYCKEPQDPRVLELVNKTNQFNLNGKRHTEVAWRNYVNQPDAILMVAAYRDKYGPLGKIAVLACRKIEKTIVVDAWVQSCRAFSRRIEHRCLEELFAHHPVDELIFDFQSTPKNGPLRVFLAEMLGADPTPKCRLSRELFLKRRVETFHEVREVSNG